MTEVNPESASADPIGDGEESSELPRPAPLKLVQAQRIDEGTSNAQQNGPVTPRRGFEKNTGTSTQNAGSFEEFVNKMNARELPELLEAAAAYSAFVEGAADGFSRTQLMSRVRNVANEDFKREHGLRCFEDLLDAGRFVKVGVGRFRVADDTRFNPKRAAS